MSLIRILGVAYPPTVHDIELLMQCSYWIIWENPHENGTFVYFPNCILFPYKVLFIYVNNVTQYMKPMHVCLGYLTVYISHNSAIATALKNTFYISLIKFNVENMIFIDMCFVFMWYVSWISH